MKLSPDPAGSPFFFRGDRFVKYI
ncbi:hypothetical protein BVIET440_50013 [Burkholderia vietnamiensis]